jgi:salicylate hydroxylase
MPDAENGPFDRHALIVGAGIGGLTAALFLARAGWRVTIAEREAMLTEMGAGIQLAPNATRLLARLGLMPDFQDLAVRPSDFVIRGHKGNRLHESTFGAKAEQRFGAPFLVIHRGELQRVLLHHVLKNPAITLRLGLKLTDFREKPEGISGLFEPASGPDERIDAAVLIGADGLWSRARPLSGLPGPSAPQGKTAWRGLIPRAAAPIFAREAKVNLWLGPNGHVVHYPVSGGEQVNVVAIIDEDWLEEGWNAPGDPDQLNQLFRGWGPDLQALISAADGWKRWALIDRASEHRWSRPRLTLLGDAAHPMLPFLAQGASQAIEDGAALAALLATVSNAQDLAKALQRYEGLRLPHTARVQRAARRQGRIYHLDGLMAAARDLTLRLMPEGQLLERFSWIFAHDAEAITGSSPE